MQIICFEFFGRRESSFALAIGWDTQHRMRHVAGTRDAEVCISPGVALRRSSEAEVWDCQCSCGAESEDVRRWDCFGLLATEVWDRKRYEGDGDQVTRPAEGREQSHISPPLVLKDSSPFVY